MGWRGIGRWGPVPIDDDDGAEPYLPRSIDSLLAVLRRRDCRDAGAGADRDGDGDDGDEIGGTTPVPVPVPTLVDAETTDLGPRDEAPRLLVWAAGAARLISCSEARPGLVACLGFGCGPAGGTSWSGPALVGLFAPCSLLMGGWSSLTSNMNLRLAMMGGSSLSKWKSDQMPSWDYTALLDWQYKGREVAVDMGTNTRVTSPGPVRQYTRGCSSTRRTERV